MAKTIKELNFNSLFMEYKILHKIDANKSNERFAELFNEYVKQCANKLYDGDVNSVAMHKALYNNLVSDKFPSPIGGFVFLYCSLELLILVG